LLIGFISISSHIKLTKPLLLQQNIGTSAYSDGDKKKTIAIIADYAVKRNYIYGTEV